MRTTRPDNYRLFTLGASRFRWWTKETWQNGTQPDHIVIDQFAQRICPDGIPRLYPIDPPIRAKVALLIADQQRSERDAARREELEHEDMVDRYEAALLEGGAS